MFPDPNRFDERSLTVRSDNRVAKSSYNVIASTPLTVRSDNRVAKSSYNLIASTHFFLA